MRNETICVFAIHPLYLYVLCVLMRSVIRRNISPRTDTRRAYTSGRAPTIGEYIRCLLVAENTHNRYDVFQDASNNIDPHSLLGSKTVHATNQILLVIH